MSFSIYSNEEITIKNTSAATRKAAASLAGYLGQFYRMQNLYNLRIFHFTLTVDGRTVMEREMEYFQGNVMCDIQIAHGENGIEIMDTPIKDDSFIPEWKDDGALLQLLPYLPDAREISLKLSYAITQTSGADYSVSFWKPVFENGPIDGVDCRLLYQYPDEGIRCYAVAYNKEHNGDVPFDQSAEDMSGISVWYTDGYRLLLENTEDLQASDFCELSKKANAFVEKYSLEPVSIPEDDEFSILSCNRFTIEEVPGLMRDTKFFCDYAKAHNLSFVADCYLYPDDGSFALIHFFAQDGKFLAEYCRF